MDNALSARQGILRSITRSLIVTLLMIGVAACSSGGGNGDDDGDGNDRAPPVPSSVAYSASFGGLDLEFDGIEVHADIGLHGLYRRATRHYTFGAESILTGFVATITPGNGLPTLEDSGGIRLQVTEQLQFAYGQRPTVGAVRIGEGNTVEIRVNNNIDGSGEAGVDLTYFIFGEEIISSHTWPEFESLMSINEAPNYSRAASAAWYMLRILFDHVQTLMEQTIHLTENDDVIEAAGSNVGVLTDCDPFSDTVGNRRFIWTDGPGENPGELGPGDRFRVIFNNCYVDRDTITAGMLYHDGDLRLNDYVEGRNPFAIGWFDTRLEALRTTRIDKNGAPVIGTEITASSFGYVDDAPTSAIGFHFLLSPDTSTIINAGNVFDVADAAINGLLLPPQVGEIFLDILIAAALDPGVDNICTDGGSHSVDPIPAGDDAPASGKAYDLTFTACALDGALLTLDGTASMEIDSLSGTLDAPGTYDIAITIDPIALSVNSDGDDSTLSGATRFARNSSPPSLTHTSTNVPGKQLVLNESFVNTLGPYTITSSENTGSGAFVFGIAGDTLQVDRSDIPGILTVTVEQPIAGSGEDPPQSGRIVIEAEDGGELTASITNGVVTLELDSNGDGTLDDTLQIPWIDLIE